MTSREISWHHNNKKELFQAVSNAQSVADQHLNKDMGYNALSFDVHADHILIKLTQFDNMLIQKLPIKTDQEQGRFLVSLQILYEILKNLPDDKEIHISLMDQQINIKYPGGHFQILCMTDEKQMSFIKMNLPVMYQIQAKHLYGILNQVSGFIGDDNTCIYLNGLYIHHRDDGIVFVATDAHRLLHKKITQDSIKVHAEIPNMGFLLPRKAVMSLQKLLYNNLTQNVSVSFCDKQMQFIVNNILFITNALEGEFPDYTSVLLDTKTAQESLLIKDTEPFLQALGRIMCFTRQKSNMVNLQLNANKDSWLELHEKSIGQAREIISIQPPAKDRVLDINGRYLWEMIKCINGASVRLYFYTNAPQILFTVDNDPSFIGLLMPMYRN